MRFLFTDPRCTHWTLATEARATRLRDLILTYGTRSGCWTINLENLKRALRCASDFRTQRFLSQMLQDGALAELTEEDDQLELRAADWFLFTGPMVVETRSNQEEFSGPDPEEERRREQNRLRKQKSRENERVVAEGNGHAVSHTMSQPLSHQNGRDMSHSSHAPTDSVTDSVTETVSETEEDIYPLSDSESDSVLIQSADSKKEQGAIPVLTAGKTGGAIAPCVKQDGLHKWRDTNQHLAETTAAAVGNPGAVGLLVPLWHHARHVDNGAKNQQLTDGMFRLMHTCSEKYNQTGQPQSKVFYREVLKLFAMVGHPYRKHAPAAVIEEVIDDPASVRAAIAIAPFQQEGIENA